SETSPRQRKPQCACEASRTSTLPACTLAPATAKNTAKADPAQTRARAKNGGGNPTARGRGTRPELRVRFQPTASFEASTCRINGFKIGGQGRNRTGVRGFAVRARIKHSCGFQRVSVCPNVLLIHRYNPHSHVAALLFGHWIAT